nr:immunoglobulin light chain junction region [Macaca mulatta]
CQHAYGFQLTF